MLRVGEVHALDEFGEEGFQCEQAFAQVEQAVAAAGAGQGLQFAEQQVERVDVPAFAGQALAAAQQRIQPTRQVAQERLAQLRILLGIVLPVHAPPAPFPVAATIARAARG